MNRILKFKPKTTKLELKQIFDTMLKAGTAGETPEFRANGAKRNVIVNAAAVRGHQEGVITRLFNTRYDIFDAMSNSPYPMKTLDKIIEVVHRDKRRAKIRDEFEAAYATEERIIDLGIKDEYTFEDHLSADARDRMAFNADATFTGVLTGNLHPEHVLEAQFTVGLLSGNNGDALETQPTNDVSTLENAFIRGWVKGRALRLENDKHNIFNVLNTWLDESDTNTTDSAGFDNLVRTVLSPHRLKATQYVKTVNRIKLSIKNNNKKISPVRQTSEFMRGDWIPRPLWSAYTNV